MPGDKALQAAKELIEKTFVMDCHFDLAMDMDDRRELGSRRVYSDRHQDYITAGGVNCIVSSLFIHSWQLPEMGLRKALDQISALMSEAEEQPDRIAVCTSMSEVRAANSEGKVGVLLSFEGLDPIGNDLSLLKIFHRLGVRGVTVAWSRRNYAADGCSFNPLVEGKKGGLTAFGVEAVREAERLGMVIDISHLNDEGVLDIVRFTEKPFIASHSNCRALVPSMRNLTDEQIKLVAERGGVIGMNACSSFVVKDQTRKAGPLELTDHIDHIVKLVGDDHVGLGLDLCDRLADFHRTVADIQSNDVLAHHGQIVEFVAHLVKKGYGDDSIQKIIGGNFARVFEQMIG